MRKSLLNNPRGPWPSEECQAVAASYREALILLKKALIESRVQAGTAATKGADDDAAKIEVCRGSLRTAIKTLEAGANYMEGKEVSMMDL